MKKYLKSLLVVALVVPCLIVMTACFGSENIGKEMTVSQWSEAQTKIEAGLGALETEMAGWSGIAITGKGSSTSTVTKTSDTIKESDSANIDVKVKRATDTTQAVASINVNTKTSSSSKTGSMSLEGKSNVYFAGGVAYDNILKTKETGMSASTINAIVSEGMNESGIDVDDFKDALKHFQNAHSKTLSDGSTQITVTLDLTKKYTAEVTGYNEHSMNVFLGRKQELVSVTGKATITVVLGAENKIIELKRSDDYTVTIKTTVTKSDEVVEEWTKKDTYKSSVAVTKFIGDITAPSGHEDYKEAGSVDLFPGFGSIFGF